jgi:hypothetical protein
LAAGVAVDLSQNVAEPITRVARIVNQLAADSGVFELRQATGRVPTVAGLGAIAEDAVQ